MVETGGCGRRGLTLELSCKRGAGAMPAVGKLRAFASFNDSLDGGRARPALSPFGGPTPERDHVSIWILDVEVLRAPRRRRQRPEYRHFDRDTARVERLDASHARRGVQVFVLTPVAALRVILLRLLQVQLQPVQLPDRVEPVPRFAEREAELLLVRSRARQVIHQDLGREGRQVRPRRRSSHRSHDVPGCKPSNNVRVTVRGRRATIRPAESMHGPASAPADC